MKKINEFQKYPGDKKAYDETYLRVFETKNTECQQCLGGGVFAGKECTTCKGTGKVEEKK